jgi:hypothetical protein
LTVNHAVRFAFKFARFDMNVDGYVGQFLFNFAGDGVGDPMGQVYRHRGIDDERDVGKAVRTRFSGF